MTNLTVPISAPDFDRAKQQIETALQQGAEMLELRSDYLEDLSVELVGKLISEIKNNKIGSVPIIVACRDKRQGGVIDYPIELRIDVLAGALKAGAEFIDFEYHNFLVPQNQGKIRTALSQISKGRLILSTHDFQGKFKNSRRLHRHILTVFPAAIPKLIYTANHINDCFDAFDLLYRTSDKRIVFCMGQAGLISRIIAKKLGSFVTFASIDEQSATAPGQLRIEQFKKLYRYDSIDPETELFGVIGSPIAHSLSPAIHNACFDDIKANKIYLPLHLEGGSEEFNSFMKNAASRGWLGFRGFSVTLPHKKNALDFLKERGGYIEPLAKKIGAVNTLLIDKQGGLKGYNTDCAGALDAITSTLKIERADLKDVPVAVIGAGGVARAVVAGLANEGANVTIYNRTLERGKRLALGFGCNYMPLEELSNLQAKLLVNCTSIGMHPDIEKSPIPQECLKKDMAVFDTVYNPAQTLLLKQAKQAGAKTIDGVSMFVNQALAQFKLFTGQDGNASLMRKTISNYLA